MLDYGFYLASLVQKRFRKENRLTVLRKIYSDFNILVSIFRTTSPRSEIQAEIVINYCKLQK